MSILSLTLYLQAAESVDLQASDDITSRTRTLWYVRRCALCVGVGSLVITTGHQKQEEEVKKIVQIKERAAKRRKILPCGILREKKQNEGPALFQVRHIHVC